MRKQLLLAAALISGAYWSVNAQERYKDEIFTNAQINVVNNVQFGTNKSIFPPGGVSDYPLMMDIYHPDNTVDNVTNRPWVIVLHSGNFLPPVINGSATGTRKDSSIVEACRMFARRGYVAFAATYRLGWNPTSTDEEVRRGTLLQAVYRAILDVKTCMRFIRKETATNSNPYKIDPTKNAIYGQGTGGYVALATAYLDKQSEIELPKFISQITSAPLFVAGQSYVLPAALGNFDGSGGSAVFNNYEHAGYSNDVKMVMNVGGALADTSWINAGEPAVASAQCIRDPFAPFNSGIVIVPTTQEDVVDVQGANQFILNANAKGLNNAYKDLLFFGDPITARARELYNRTYGYDLIDANGTVNIGNAEGLFAFDRASRTAINRFANEGSPWDWWSKPVLDATVAAVNQQTGGSYDANQIHAGGLLSNPDMSGTKGRTHLDTIIRYFTPRMMRVLEIGNWQSLGVENNQNNTLSVYPNPAKNQVIIANDGTLNNIQIFDLSGKLVRTEAVNGRNNVQINISGLAEGMYIIQAQGNDKMMNTKLLVK
jgi:hypothetical protein